MTRPLYLLAALICTSSLAFGATACGNNQNDQNQNQNQDQNQNQNNNDQNNNNQNNNNQNNNNQTPAQQKAECLKNAPDPRDCEDIP